MKLRGVKDTVLGRQEALGRACALRSVLAERGACGNPIPRDGVLVSDMGVPANVDRKTAARHGA